MVKLSTPTTNQNLQASDFNLPDPNNQQWSLKDCQGTKGLLVMFICNHCPYVQSILKAIKEDTDKLLTHQIKSVAIMSNDINQYPEDAPQNMQHLSEQQQFKFPYLYDQTQSVAKQYGAVCTPDFFGFDQHLKLCYRGRLRSENNTPELRSFMIKLANNQNIDHLTQQPSIGCSIKWK